MTSDETFLHFTISVSQMVAVGSSKTMLLAVDRVSYDKEETPEGLPRWKRPPLVNTVWPQSWDWQVLQVLISCNVGKEVYYCWDPVSCSIKYTFKKLPYLFHKLFQVNNPEVCFLTLKSHSNVRKHTHTYTREKEEKWRGDKGGKWERRGH